jgi:hypothetical protein
MDQLVFNGLDVDSGDYLLPPLTVDEISQIAQGQRIDEERLGLLRLRRDRDRAQVLGVEEGVDPTDLSEAGWGVIFPGGTDVNPLRHALGPLLRLRREQATKRKDLYREFSGADGVFASQRALDWLAGHGAGPGPAVPEKVPYYLLIVGSPEQIAYEFQYDLDVQYGVGRLYFDTAEGDFGPYAEYARAVVAAERGQIVLPRQVRFFGAANLDDDATQLSAQQLVRPLAEKVASQISTQTYLNGWDLQSVVGEAATKARLGQLLGGAETPALLFTATHGAGFGDFSDTVKQERQLRHQGALVCQDWPGPEEWRGALKEDFYYSADDIAAGARLQGTIAFLFACYGAGTPQLDDFAHNKSIGGQPEPIAPRPFVAALPQRLLGHPGGGALAVVGHVERATGYSFAWPDAGRQTAVFESALIRLMRGQPIGWALEFFNQRYAELATNLSQLQTMIIRGRKPDNFELSRIWTANNDARSYVVLGDPAVRLAVGDAPPARPITFDELLTPVSTPAIQPTAVSAPNTPITDGPSAAEQQASAAPQPQAGSASAPKAPAAEGVTFGLLDRTAESDQKRQPLQNLLDDVALKLGEKLQQLVGSTSGLEVKTFVSEDIDKVSYTSTEGAPNLSGASLRVLTRVEFGGDTVVCVPQVEGQIDQALLKLHTDMVGQAQSARTEMMKAAIEALAGLIKLGR